MYICASNFQYDSAKTKPFIDTCHTCNRFVELSSSFKSNVYGYRTSERGVS